MTRWSPAHEVDAAERIRLAFRSAEPVPAKPRQKLRDAATSNRPKGRFNVAAGGAGLDSAQLLAARFGRQPADGAGLLLSPGTMPGPAVGSATAAAAESTFQVAKSGEVREQAPLHRGQFAYATSRDDRCEDAGSAPLPPLRRALARALARMAAGGAVLPEGRGPSKRARREPTGTPGRDG